MNKFLVLDTETTGFKPPKCRVAQLAFMLVDESGNSLMEYSSFIKPNGWEVPKEQFFIDNNMSTERCEEFGKPAFEVFRAFQDALKQADYTVAHNMNFDRPFVLHELRTAGITHELMQFKKSICTMHSTTNFCKLPGRYGKYKWPKLEELHVQLFNKEMENAHDALADVKATSRCLIECLELGIIKI